MRRLDSAFAATLTGLVDRLRPRDAERRLGPERLDGKSCLVTGASRGLGRAIAQELARRGARLVLPCRRDHAETRRAMLGAGAPEVMTPHVDLADVRSIEALADELRDRGERLDVAVLNAGVVTRSARRSAQGVEMMVAVNFLAKVALLTRLLEDGVIDNAVFAPARRTGSTARIVIVSSEAHRSAAAIDVEGLTRFESFGASRSVARYGYSKLLLTSMAMELSRRLRDGDEVDVSVHALCPGAVNTDIAREAPGWVKPMLYPVMRALFRSPEAAAAPAIYLACSAEIEGQTGLYLHHMTDKQPSDVARDAQRGRELWDAAQRFLREDSVRDA